MGIPEEMREFLQSLFESGQVTVPFLVEQMPSVEEVAILIQDFDAAARLNLPGMAPELELDAAYWAASILMQASRFLISRDTEVSAIQSTLSAPCPSARSAKVDYSVDLFFQYLPDLYHFAKRLAPDDPLVGVLEKLATEWPLSSVAIEDVNAGSLESFIEDRCLRRLYADRVIAFKALKRLDDARVSQTVQTSYGAYPELCPEISRHIEKIIANPDPEKLQFI